MCVCVEEEEYTFVLVQYSSHQSECCHMHINLSTDRMISLAEPEETHNCFPFLEGFSFFNCQVQTLVC